MRRPNFKVLTTIFASLAAITGFRKATKDQPIAESLALNAPPDEPHRRIGARKHGGHGRRQPLFKVTTAWKRAFGGLAVRNPAKRFG